MDGKQKILTALIAIVALATLFTPASADSPTTKGVVTVASYSAPAQSSAETPQDQVKDLAY